MNKPEKSLTDSAVAKRWPTLRVGLVSALLLWLSQPPMGWWPLAWIAPIGWLAIASREESLDRGDWWRVYLSGLVYWLAVLHWIRLPHPLTIFGWPLLCLYLACYPFLFVVLTRRAVHRLKTPLWIAAPIIWTGLEYLQAHLFTGFLMGSLSHSQARVLSISNLAHYFGAYGITCLIVTASALLLSHLPDLSIKNRFLFAGKVLFAIALISYFSFLTYSNEKLFQNPVVNVALIQGDTRATWDPDPGRQQRIMDRQVALSIEAIEKAKAAKIELDLIVWPESMFRSPIDTFDGALTPSPNENADLVRSYEHTAEWFKSLANRLQTPALVGIDHYDWVPDPESETGLPTPRPYNSAALIDKGGKLLSIYDKTHRVPFGEYIPFAENMPAMYYLTPMSGGLRPGEGPVAMSLSVKEEDSPIRIAPSICYETVVPHVIRRHVAELTEAGEAPELLVNVTNDAWFWGSSELDMHLACAIYRAIETGTPLVVAANGGLSAAISASGEVLALSPRQEEHVLLASVPLRTSSRPTFYVRYGDCFAGGCLVCCCLVLLSAWLPRVMSPKDAPPT